jgi:hypothetical protein
MINSLTMKFFNEKGSGLIENLVSLSMLAIVIASVSSAILLTMHGNASSRTYASVIADVQSIVDSLRHGTYTQILDKFNSSYGTINNNQTTSEIVRSSESRAIYTVTYTAIKRSANAIPDAVKVRVNISHSKGHLGNSTTAFETIIAGST